MVLYFGFFSEDFNLSNAGEEKVWSLAGNYLLKLASKNINFSNAGGEKIWQGIIATWLVICLILVLVL